MIDLKSIFGFVLGLLLMGFFAGIEMAFYSANRLAIELKKKQGGNTGKLLAMFTDSPVRFLGTTLIGFHIFLVFFGLQISCRRRHGSRRWRRAWPMHARASAAWPTAPR